MIQKIRALRKKVDNLKYKLKEVDENIKKKERSYENVINQKKNLEAELKRTEQILESTESSDELIVSDHSLIRYLERVKGIDVEALREEIVSDEMRTLYKSLGDGKYPIEQTGGRAVIKNGIVVSIVEN